MQIELSFRDLKSDRYANAIKDTPTRKEPCIEVLLLISPLAAFVSWLIALACEASGVDESLMPLRSKRRLYSLLRIGREALVRRWPVATVTALTRRLRHPDARLRDQSAMTL